MTIRGMMGALVLSGVLAGSSGAQVGYPPAGSPFLDLDRKHEVTVYGGYFAPRKDPAGVAPQGGPMGGLLYEWRASGPVHIGGELMMVRSSRRTLDPARPNAERDLGTKSQPLYAANAFVALSLTGGRTWNGLMPMIGAGLGAITNTKSADVGGYRFGTRFAFPWGAGVRWVPGNGNLQLRADVKDWMYTIAYPQSYYTSTAPNTPILTPTTRTSRWTHNFAATVGVSYIFAR